MRVMLDRKSIWHVLTNFKCLRNTYFSFIHSYINYANITWASTNKTKLNKQFGKQKQATRIIFNQDRLTHASPLLKTLNALNVYQIILQQVLLFMHKIKISSSLRIFLHQFETINHKYATGYSRIVSKSQRETLILPNIVFMRAVRLSGAAF